MTLEQLAAIAEIVSGFAVLVSLIYLAIELRENTRTIKANANSEVYLNWSTFNEMMTQHPERLLFTSSFDPNLTWESFGPDEQVALNFFGRAMVQKFQAVFFLHDAGIVDEEVWRQNSTWCRSFLEYPVWRFFWESESKQPIFSQAFLAAIQNAPSMEISMEDLATQIAGVANVPKQP